MKALSEFLYKTLYFSLLDLELPVHATLKQQQQTNKIFVAVFCCSAHEPEVTSQ